MHKCCQFLPDPAAAPVILRWSQGWALPGFPSGQK
jgi:hypothetical protein